MTPKKPTEKVKQEELEEVVEETTTEGDVGEEEIEELPGGGHRVIHKITRRYSK